MKTIRSLAELRAELAPARRDGRSIGLVPTMGAFHDGHLSLMRRARAETDIVVVWLFVNPAQFNDSADLAAYPRDEARDAELAAARGRRLPVRPCRRGRLPARFRDNRVDRRTDRHAGRAHTVAARTSTASRPWSRRCSTWSGPTSPTSGRRTRSRRSSSSDWFVTSTCRSGSRSPPRSVMPTGSRYRAATRC